MFLLNGGMLIRAALMVGSVIWIIWYFKELPKYIKDTQESKRTSRSEAVPETPGEPTKIAQNKETAENRRLDYVSNVWLLIIFSLITVFAAIYFIRSIIGIAINIIRAL